MRQRGSMLIEHYRAMARYNRWMNETLYAVAAELTDEERKRDLGAFFKSLHGTFNHLLIADRVWSGRFSGDPKKGQSLDASGRPIPLNPSVIAYEDFDQLRRERARTDDDIDAWLSTLDDDGLAKPFAYKNLAGEPFEHPMWWALSHFFNHQTHHRGQATTLIKQLGRDPGVTDLIAMLRSESNNR